MLDATQWAQVVELAVRAPSIHNTQPWRFTVDGDRLLVATDPGRALPVIDPTGRQRFISCGVAAHLAVVALHGAGYDADVVVAPAASSPVVVPPEEGDPDLVATITVRGRRPATPDDAAMIEAISARHTDRTPFRHQAVPPDLIEGVQAEVGREGVWLEPITRGEEELAAVFLIDQAEQLERSDPAYLAELDSWLRADADASDGVPVAALPAGNPAMRASNWLIRDFVAGRRAPDTAVPPVADDDPPPAVERPSVLLLGTMNDDREAWVRAGIALGRLLLRVTVAGLAASPLTQALDLPATRAQLTQRLHLLGHPQMLVRLGYPAGPAVASGRRPVGEVLATRD